MIYRIWDTETNQYVKGGFIDFQGYVWFISMGTLIFIEDQSRFKIEWGFKIGDKCFYEGDIIEYIYGIFAPRYIKLEFCASSGFYLYMDFNWQINISENFDDSRYSFVVIGNVNQNPELLETK